MGKDITITVHRGLDQIDGSITEIATERSRIFIDMGDNLPGSGEWMDDDARREFVEALFRQNPRRHQAVVYTHAHSDHVGMAEFVPEGVGQYLSMGSFGVLMKKNKVFVKQYELLGDEEGLAGTRRTAAMLDGMEKWTEWGKPFLVGDIAVQPFAVSHSIYGAGCLVITTHGRKILHTGDFRIGKRGYPDIRNVVRKFAGRIDVLITEGTNLLEADRLCREDELLPEFVEAFTEKKYTFVLTSSTDIERLHNIREAAEQSGRLFVASSLIFYNMLDYFERKWRKRYAPFRRLSPSEPDGELVSEMREKGFVMPVAAGHLERTLAIAAMFDRGDMQLVYSAWPGYYTFPEQVEANSSYSAFREAFDSVRDIHVSGHADRATIAEVIELLQPQEAIIGIHKPPLSSLVTLPLRAELKAKIVDEAVFVLPVAR